MAVTIKDIARDLGVAPSTVSNVLNGRMKGSYPKAVRRAEKIRAYAEKAGYRPNAAARAVRTNRTFQIGVLLPNRPKHSHTHPNAFEGVLGVNSGLQDDGYIVSIIRFDDLTENVSSQTRLFTERILDGMVVIGRFPEWAPAELAKLVPRIIWMDSDVWRRERCIRRHEFDAARLAVNKVAAAGYRKILWLSYPSVKDFDHYSQTQRHAAVLETAEQEDLDVEKLDLVPTSEHAVWDGIKERLAPDTMILAQTVYHAQLFSNHMAARGLTAPRDFGLACCENSQETDRLWPELSRVSFDRFDMGRQAAQMLKDLLDDDDLPVQSRLMTGHWINGTTTNLMTTGDRSHG